MNEAKTKGFKTKPCQALFVTKEGAMFLQEGYFRETASLEYPDTLVANVMYTGKIVDKTGEPETKAVLLKFSHGEVVLDTSIKINVYYETGPADPDEIPTTISRK